MSERGYFITFEGIEGAGKSTQVKILSDALTAQGIAVVVTREPGGTVFAEKIRTRLLKKGDRSGISEAMLLSLARANHIKTLIRPAIQQGKWVICDRFIDSTRAYQGGGRGVAPWLLEMFIRLSVGTMLPDITFVLDMAPEAVAARIKDRADMNHFDNQEQDFFARVQTVYHQLAETEPGRVHLIDASLPEAKVATVIEETIRRKLIPS